MEDTQITITIHENLAMELVTALSTAAEAQQRPQKESVALEHVTEWLEHLNRTCSPFQQSDLSIVFSTVTSRLFLFYQVLDHGITRIEDLIGQVENLSTREFLEAFRRLLSIDEQEEWINTQQIRQALEVDRLDIKLDLDREAANLVHMLRAPEDYRRRITDVLSWFSQEYLLPHGEKILSGYRNFREKFEAEITGDPARAVDQLTSGNLETALTYSTTFHLYLGYFLNDEVSILMPDEIYLIAGIVHAGHLLSRQEHEYTDELLKALSDPRRLAILRLLRLRPWFSKELAEELKLTAATVSYHMDILFRAELIRIERSGGRRRFYYALNPKGMRRLITSLTREFLSGEDNIAQIDGIC